MKTLQLYACLIIFCFSGSLFAQEELTDGLLFPQFEKGTVIYTNGSRTVASFNYNMISEEMLFVNTDSAILTIANPEDILVININERRFFPITKSIFYEEIPVEKGSFYIQWKSIKISEGKASGYGGHSQTSSITNIGSLKSSSGLYVTLGSGEKFRTKVNNGYFLKSGENYKKFSSSKTLSKLFKGHESEIERFAQEQAVDFSKIDDVSRIVEYGFCFAQ